jgi:hypothetical protein
MEFSRPRLLALIACILPFTLSLPASEITGTWAIALDTGPFASVQEAAHAEATVDWNGPDTRRQNACTIAYAATELQAFLRELKKSGEAGFECVTLCTEFPSSAIILSTLPDALAHEELAATVQRHGLNDALTHSGSFALVPDGDRLIIIGQDRVGVLYGVYHILEQLGIRWYGPEPHETFVPESISLSLPEQPIIENPDFQTRGFWVRQDFGNEPFYHWMARNKLNFWSIAEPNRALLHKLGMHLTYGGHEHFIQFMNPSDPYPYDHPLYRGDEDKQPDPDEPNPDSFLGDRNEDGVLSFFEARPEWYGLINGVRTPVEGSLKTANICTSNPHALQHLFSSIIEELASGEWQDVASLNFWPIDMGVWCECDACTPLGSPTDRLLLMVHGLDKAIDASRASGRIHRDIKIVFPIYQETLAAPTRPLPEDFNTETCIGTFFPINRCYVHSIDDPTCTEYNTAHWQSFLDWIQKEPRYYHGELFVGEYFNVSVNKSLPVLYSRIIGKDVPKYFEQGARHMHYMHTDTRLLGMKRLNNFLFANVLWDASADTDALKAAYVENLYGPVSAEVADLYETLEYGLSNIKQFRYWLHLPERFSEGTDPLFHTRHFQLEESHPETDDGVDLSQSVAAMKRCRRIMDTLLEMNLPVAVQERLLIDDKLLRYGENTIHFTDAVARAYLAERRGDLEEARRQFIRSIPFARALKAEQEVVKTATNNHVHAKNGLDATRMEAAYIEMGQRLFPHFTL